MSTSIAAGFAAGAVLAPASFTCANVVSETVMNFYASKKLSQSQIYTVRLLSSAATSMILMNILAPSPFSTAFRLATQLITVVAGAYFGIKIAQSQILEEKPPGYPCRRINPDKAATMGFLTGAVVTAVATAVFNHLVGTCLGYIIAYNTSSERIHYERLQQN